MMLNFCLRASLLSLLLSTAAAQDNLFPNSLRTPGHLLNTGYAHRAPIFHLWTETNGPLPGTDPEARRIRITGLSASEDTVLCNTPLRALEADVKAGRYTYDLNEYGLIEHRQGTCVLILPFWNVRGITLSAAGTLLSIHIADTTWHFETNTGVLVTSATTNAAARPATSPVPVTTDAPAAVNTGAALPANFATRIDTALSLLPTRQTNTDDDARQVTGRDCRPGSHELSGRTWDGGPDSYARAISQAIATGKTDFQVVSSDWAREPRTGNIAAGRILWQMVLIDTTTGDQLFVRILRAGDVVALNTCRLE